MAKKRAAHDQAAGAASAAESSQPLSAKRNYQHEETAVLSWLSNADNRNIVTGAAGSVQNGGSLSGSKVVTSKDAGWGMLAAHLSKSCGVTFDKKQAQNKFTYLEKKYHAAKIWQNTSGVGITDADRQRGINSIPDKLVDMCPKFEMWESWFGTHQKYSPSSIVQSGVPTDFESGDDAASEGSANRDIEVDEVHGGPDGQFGDVEGRGKQLDDSANDRVDDESGGTPHGRESVAPTPSRQSPSESSALNGVVASPPGLIGTGRGAGAGGRGRGTGANTASNAVALQKAQLTQVVMNRPVPPIISSPSQSTSSSKNSFDGVYAEAAKNKCATLMDISQNRNLVEAQQQVAEHAFKRDDRSAHHEFQRELELRKQAQEHKFQQEQKALQLLSDRQEANARKQIEYDKTLASLLVADKSGKLADDFEARRGRERAAAASAVDPVSAFLQQLIPRARDN